MNEDKLKAWRASYDPDWDRLRFVCPKRHGPLIAILRPVLAAAGWPRNCYRADCRRATRCVAPRTDCAFRDIRIIRRDIFPFLERVADAKAAARRAAADEDDNPSASQQDFRVSGSAPGATTARRRRAAGRSAPPAPAPRRPARG